MKPDSQCSRVLDVLKDGRPHSAAEIHQRAGFMRLNSRVAELRSREGLTITCEHRGGVGAGAFVYTLLSEREQRGMQNAPERESEVASSGCEAYAPRSRSQSSVLTIGESPSSSTASDKPPEEPQAAAPTALTHSVVGAQQLDLFGAAA